MASDVFRGIPAASQLGSRSKASEHGTYYAADGSKARFKDAMAAWVPIAREVLIDVARDYNRSTTYLELTDVVQERSGIRTKSLIGNWSGRLLEDVAQHAADADEPPLTSLCVHQDGTISAGYSTAPKSVPSDPGADVDELAAQHRLLCYQRYATDLPIDGGVPTLTPKFERPERGPGTGGLRRDIATYARFTSSRRLRRVSATSVQTEISA